MPNRSRHRKGQLTVLPAGSRVQTGKARTAAKAAQFDQPLPIRVSASNKTRTNVQAQQQQQRRRRSNANRSSWSTFLSYLIQWGCNGTENKPIRRPEVAVAQYDPITNTFSLNVTEEDGKAMSASMALLWECGFFGKGTLSRSEPTWRARQAQTQAVQRQRARGKKIFTPEELTALRRKERKAAKIERARLAVRAGQQLADGIVALGGELNEEDERIIARQVRQDLDDQKGEDGDRESEYGKHIPGLIYLKPSKQETNTDANATVIEKEEENDEEEFVDVEDMERLQLSAQETFFLAGMLGVLDVVDERGRTMSIEHLYALLLSASLPKSYGPLAASPFQTPSLDDLQLHVDAWARPDNPFLLQYVVYHHFRSLGWVVRSGIKFCVDWLLYKRGPAFGHAEFAVVVLPLYECADDERRARQSSPFDVHPNAQPREWVWFSSVNRVNTQVLKTLILCYVIIPPLQTPSTTQLDTPQAFVRGLQNGTSFRTCEFSVRRFTPQRMRA